MAARIDMSKRKNWIPVMHGTANVPSNYSAIGDTVSPGTPRTPSAGRQRGGVGYARPASMSDGAYPPSPPIDYNSPMPSVRDAPLVPLPRDVIPRVNLAHLIGADDTPDSALHQNAAYSRVEDPNDYPCRDFYFDSEKVLSLNCNNFTTFLRSTEATLAMFYNDSYPESDAFQTVFSEAANNAKRENHAFVGVDCLANPRLCAVNGVCKVPIIRLYSRHYCLGEIKTLHSISADILRQYVEMAPMSDSTRMVACRRPRR